MDDHQDSRLAAIPGDENHLQHLSEHDGSTPFTGSGVLAEEDLFSISQHASRYVSPPITHNLSAIQNLHSQHQELPLVSAVFFDAIISNGLILETKKMLGQYVSFAIRCIIWRPWRPRILPYG